MAALRSVVALRPAPARLGFAIRAAICMGLPVLVATWLGRPSDGLMATIGAFTALYGTGRPYVHRAAMLAAIAAGMVCTVIIGLVTSGSPMEALVATTLVAMLATLLCRQLNTGPPGAYLFALACAVGTALPSNHLTIAHVALLVASGGALSWVAHMTGALLHPRKPETNAVLRAVRATCDFIRAVGTPAQDAARHAAALALHEVWTALVTYQPLHRVDDAALANLRSVARDLHVLFADTIASAARGEAPDGRDLARGKALAQRARQAQAPGVSPSVSELPLGRLSAMESLREALQPGSATTLVVARVGIAAFAAGALGAAMGLEHAYWTIAAAVLVLHAGFDWRRTVRRGLERLVGTWLGLLAAAGVLAARPQGVWLAATIAALQFTIEMLVLRNYALAVIAITAVALVIAHAGVAAEPIVPLLLTRGVDTTLGCLVGIAVYALITPRAAPAGLRRALAGVLAALPPVLAHLDADEVSTQEARVDRRALQRHLFALTEAYDAGVAGTPRERRHAEQLWPAIVAAQRVGYGALSLCWRREHGGSDLASDRKDIEAEARQLLQSGGETTTSHYARPGADPVR